MEQQRQALLVQHALALILQQLGGQCEPPDLDYLGRLDFEPDDEPDDNAADLLKAAWGAA